MVAGKLVGKSAGALGIHNKVLGDASWVHVRLPGKASDSDKGEGKTPHPRALKPQEGGPDVTVGTKGVVFFTKTMDV